MLSGLRLQDSDVARPYALRVHVHLQRHTIIVCAVLSDVCCLTVMVWTRCHMCVPNDARCMARRFLRRRPCSHQCKLGYLPDGHKSVLAKSRNTGRGVDKSNKARREPLLKRVEKCTL